MLKVSVSLLILVAVVCTCEAQVRSRAAKRPRSPNSSAGFRCPDGERVNQYPEVKLHMGEVTTKAIGLPQPAVPERLRMSGFSGRVRAAIVIDIPTGRVVWARIESGHPWLRESARKVICQARFAPAAIDGAPMRAGGFIIYKLGP